MATMTEVAETFTEWLSQVALLLEEYDMMEAARGYVFFSDFEAGLTPAESFIMFDAWYNGEVAL